MVLTRETWTLGFPLDAQMLTLVLHTVCGPEHCSFPELRMSSLPTLISFRFKDAALCQASWSLTLCYQPFAPRIRACRKSSGLPIQFSLLLSGRRPTDSGCFSAPAWVSALSIWQDCYCLHRTHISVPCSAKCTQAGSWAEVSLV